MEHCADKEKITTDPSPRLNWNVLERFSINRATGENGVMTSFSSEVQNYTATSVLDELDAMDRELLTIKEQFLKLMTRSLILEVDLATQFNPDLYNTRDALDEQCESCSKVVTDFVEPSFQDQVMTQTDSVNEENIELYGHNILEPNLDHVGSADGENSGVVVVNDPEPNVNPAFIKEPDLQNKPENVTNPLENVDLADDNTKNETQNLGQPEAPSFVPLNEL